MENIKRQHSILVFLILLFSVSECKTYRWQKDCIHSHICCDVGCKCCQNPNPKSKSEVFQPKKKLAWNFPVILGDELNSDVFYRINGKIKGIKEYESVNSENAYNLKNSTKYSKGDVTYFKHYISNNSIEEESSYKEYYFSYDSLGNLSHEKILHVDKGDTISLIETEDLQQSILKFLPYKKLETNDSGQVTAYVFLNDTVNCTYNTLGQKLTETVEVVKDLKYKHHWYTYTKCSIIIKTSYQFVTYFTEYKFDYYGNWIEKKTTYENNSGINTFSKRVIEYE